MDRDTFWVEDRCIEGVYVRKSNTLHADARFRVLAVRRIWFGDRVGHYYRSLVYSNSCLHPQGLKWYAESLMHVTVDSFSVYTNEMPDKVTDGIVGRKSSHTIDF